MLNCSVGDGVVDGLDDGAGLAGPFASSTFRLMMCAPGATPVVSSAWSGRRRDDAGDVRAVPELVVRVFEPVKSAQQHAAASCGT